MTISVVDAGPRQVSRSVEVTAPAAELFAYVADPRRHQEVDGSGTVRENVTYPTKCAAGERFSMKMRMLGLPYRITSTVTAVKPGALIEWRHPFGHRWRWEFDELSPTLTRVTETFDFRDAGPVKNALNYYTLTGFVKSNTRGIEATLAKLRDRYSRD